MCGRFNVIDNPELQQLLRDLGIDLGVPTAINVAPTEAIAVARVNRENQRELQAMRWWLTPSWAPEVSTRYSMFNAKSETLQKSKAFRRPFERQRGIVPMSSFIEWKTIDGRKQAYLIEGEGRALAAAAIWDYWDRGEEALFSCALITTAAAEDFRDIHHRMPVLLDAGGCEQWLDPGASPDDLLPLFESQLTHDLRVTPVQPGVNNSRNKNPALLEPSGDSRLFKAA